MKKVYSFILITVFSASVFGQGFNWAKKIGSTGIDQSEFITKDLNGNLILGGQFNGTIDLDPGPNIFNVTSIGGQDFFIVKLDTNGNFLFGKSFGGTSTDALSEVAIDNNNNILICGFFRGLADFDPSPQTYTLTTGNIGADGFILKLDVNGNFVFAKQIGGNTTVDDHVMSIVTDNNGNIYATGYFNQTCDLDPGATQYTVTSVGGSDIFVLKLNALGNFIYAKTIGNTTGSAIGGTSTQTGCTGEKILINNGYVFLTGGFDSNTDFDPNNGSFNLNSNGSLDCYLLKLDLNGNFLNAISFGSSLIDYANALNFDLNGNIYIGGIFNNIVDFDPGNNTVNITSNGLKDGFLLKLNNSLQFLWCNAIGGAGDDLIHDAIIDPIGNVFITGFFQNIVDFDNSINNYNLTSTGLKDVFFACYNSNGNLNYAQKYGSVLDDEGYALIANNNKIFLAGYYQGTVDFDNSINSYNLTSSGNQDCFILSLFNNNIFTKNFNIPYLYLSIYPNPAKTQITLNTTTNQIGKTLKVYDALGKLVYESIIKQEQSNISITHWANGIYTVAIPEQNLTYKFVKE